MIHIIGTKTLLRLIIDTHRGDISIDGDSSKDKRWLRERTSVVAPLLDKWWKAVADKLPGAEDEADARRKIVEPLEQAFREAFPNESVVLIVEGLT